MSDIVHSSRWILGEFELQVDLRRIGEFHSVYDGERVTNDFQRFVRDRLVFRAVLRSNNLAEMTKYRTRLVTLRWRLWHRRFCCFQLLIHLCMLLLQLALSLRFWRGLGAFGIRWIALLPVLLFFPARFQGFISPRKGAASILVPKIFLHDSVALLRQFCLAVPYCSRFSAVFLLGFVLVSRSDLLNAIAAYLVAIHWMVSSSASFSTSGQVLSSAVA